ncbi:Protein BOLA1 chloroplastic [Dissostichus eleginoides]|uniref:Protein BOLA1 chloroplastic n=1 Tax=Dissostichus eleginoides TaxID=100907 RepID=A0AAD9C7R0_DISEL|nr:Protein BOLA1 chloroplastic [Dissostichus eleginoides]
MKGEDGGRCDRKSNFHKQDKRIPLSDPSYLSICTPWFDPEHLTPANGQRYSHMSLVGACWTERLTSEEERKRWQEKMAKAEELRNTAGIHTERLRPAYFQQAGHEGLSEWMRASEG